MAKRDRERRKGAKAWAEEQDTDSRNLSFKVPDGVQKYSLKKGNNKFDIVSFKAGASNPMCDKGEDHWERTYYIHDRIGPEQQKVACLWMNFKKKCPICEHQAKVLQREGQDAAKAFRPKKRHLFLAYVRDEKDKGLQLIDSSHFKGLGELLKDKLNSDEDGEYDDFADNKNGLTVKVFCKEESAGEGGGKWNAPKTVEFSPRKEPINPKVLKDVPCLDDAIVELSYDKLKKLFGDGVVDEDEDEDDEKPAKKKDKKDDDDSETDEEDDDGEQDESEGDDEDEDDGDGEGDEEGDDEGGEEGEEIQVGDTVEFKNKKKKKVKGEVTKINAKGKNADDPLLYVQAEDQDDLHTLRVSEVTKVESEEDDEEEEEDEKPKGKKDDEDDEWEPSGDDDEDDGDDSEDDEEEEEEEEKPKRGRKK